MFAGMNWCTVYFSGTYFEPALIAASDGQVIVLDTFWNYSGVLSFLVVDNQ
jgi:hypothetical protein